MAQISVYEECSPGMSASALGENLTAEERIALMDTHFEVELADTERCDVSQTNAASGNSGSEGGGFAGGNSATNTGGGQANAVSATTDGTAVDAQSSQTLQASPNAVDEDEQSIALSSGLAAAGVDAGTNSGGSVATGDGSNGKDPEALAAANNRQALAKSILARAQEEEDPVVKEALMQKYKELTR